jgi:N-acetylglucosaminyl-diphospho-decaprenol L-rhamnosyltransferase
MSDCVHLSIVSHGQAELVHSLLQDLACHCGGISLRVTLTVNIPETLPFATTDFPFPLALIHNPDIKGFGANHNAAFAQAPECRYFGIINPDIRLSEEVFAPLLAALRQFPATGLAAPLVFSPEGKIEDSARRLPTPFRILVKAAGGVEPPWRGDQPDWVAGMFMLVPSEAFEKVRGFDERFHLYYEDVDLCCRLRLAGYGIRLVRETQVVHAARRESRRKLLYMAWHLRSMARFFASRVFFQSWLRLK